MWEVERSEFGNLRRWVLANKFSLTWRYTSTSLLLLIVKTFPLHVILFDYTASSYHSVDHGTRDFDRELLCLSTTSTYSTALDVMFDPISILFVLVFWSILSSIERVSTNSSSPQPLQDQFRTSASYPTSSLNSSFFFMLFFLFPFLSLFSLSFLSSHEFVLKISISPFSKSSYFFLVCFLLCVPLRCSSFRAH